MKIVYGTLRRSAGALSCKCYANEPRCSPNAHLISSWSTCAFASLLPRFGRLIPYVNEAGVFFEEASSGPRPAWRLICPQEGVDAPSMETAVGGSRIINKRLTRFVFQFSNCISLSACAEISLCAPSDGSWNISIVPRRRLIIYLLRFCVCFALFIVLAFWNCVSWFISEETQRDLILKWKKKQTIFYNNIFPHRPGRFFSKFLRVPPPPPPPPPVVLFQMVQGRQQCMTTSVKTEFIQIKSRNDNKERQWHDRGSGTTYPCLGSFNGGSIMITFRLKLYVIGCFCLSFSLSLFLCVLLQKQGGNQQSISADDEGKEKGATATVAAAGGARGN